MASPPCWPRLIRARPGVGLRRRAGSTRCRSAASARVRSSSRPPPASGAGRLARVRRRGRPGPPEAGRSDRTSANRSYARPVASTSSSPGVPRTVHLPALAFVISTSAIRLPAAPCHPRIRPARSVARHRPTPLGDADADDDGDDDDGDSDGEADADGPSPVPDCEAGPNRQTPRTSPAIRATSPAVPATRSGQRIRPRPVGCDSAAVTPATRRRRLSGTSRGASSKRTDRSSCSNRSSLIAAPPARARRRHTLRAVRGARSEAATSPCPRARRSVRRSPRSSTPRGGAGRPRCDARA